MPNTSSAPVTAVPVSPSDDDFQYLEDDGEIAARPPAAKPSKDDLAAETTTEAPAVQPPPESPTRAASPESVLASPTSDLGATPEAFASDAAKQVDSEGPAASAAAELNPARVIIPEPDLPVEATSVASSIPAGSVNIKELVEGIDRDEQETTSIKPIIPPDSPGPASSPLTESEPIVIGTDKPPQVVIGTTLAATPPVVATACALPDHLPPSIIPAYGAAWPQSRTLSTHSLDSNGEPRRRSRRDHSAIEYRVYSPKAGLGAKDKLESPNGFAEKACNIVKKIFCCFYAPEVQPSRKSMPDNPQLHEALLSDDGDVEPQQKRYKH